MLNSGPCLAHTLSCSGRGVGMLPAPSPFEKAKTRSTRAPSAAWAPICRHTSASDTPWSSKPAWNLCVGV